MASSINASSSKIFTVIISYWVISISLVFLNKVLLTSGPSIPAPLFVTWFQCVLTALTCYVMGRLRISIGGKFLSQFPVQTYSMDNVRTFLPLSCIFVSMVSANQLCLKFVEVSFYNVARSLTIVFNVIFTYFMMGSTTSNTVLFALGIVVAGFIIGIEGEINFSVMGTLFGVASSAMNALNSIFTKKKLECVDNDHWRLIFINNVNASILFCPLILFSGEISIISRNRHLLQSYEFWSMMLVAGVLGFSIGIAITMQIKVTSPLTANISGTAKAAVQAVVALKIWGNPISTNGVIGIMFVLGGSSFYTYLRKKEGTKKTIKNLENNTKKTETANTEPQVKMQSIADK